MKPEELAKICTDLHAAAEPARGQVSELYRETAMDVLNTLAKDLVELAPLVPAIKLCFDRGETEAGRVLIERAVKIINTPSPRLIVSTAQPLAAAPTTTAARTMQPNSAPQPAQTPRPQPVPQAVPQPAQTPRAQPVPQPPQTPRFQPTQQPPPVPPIAQHTAPDQKRPRTVQESAARASAIGVAAGRAKTEAAKQELSDADTEFLVAHAKQLAMEKYDREH